ncbi:MAG: hypothetical protein Q8P61_09175 [Candidatus Nanopelagicales bacterium]|nr:hypothetical protein [Candidatus Nanopelagicales bacterium]
MRIFGTRKTRVIGIGGAALIAVSSLTATGAATLAHGADVPAAAVEPVTSVVEPRALLASNPSLETKLLRPRDLGSGWSEIAVGDLVGKYGSKIAGAIAGATVDPASCATGWKLPVGYESHAYRVFRKGSSSFGPYAGQLIASFDTPRAAKAAISGVRARLTDCRRLKISADIGSASVKITPVKAGRKARFAYRIEADLGGLFDATGRVSVSRQGRVVSVVGAGALGTDQASIKATAARAAVKAGRRL